MVAVRKDSTNERSHFFAENNALQIVRLGEIENDNWHFVVHAQRKCRGIHHFQLPLQCVEIRNLIEPFRALVFLRIGIVNAVHFRRFQNHFRPDFIRAQCRRRVRGKIRIARAAAENHHSPFFQMPHGTTADERFRDLCHRNRALHARGAAEFFQRVLKRQRVDDRREHAHVIAGGAFDAALAAAQAAKNISAADDHDHLHAELAHFANLPGHVLHRFGRNACAVRVAKRFAAQLEQDAGKFCFFGSRHANWSARSIAKCLTARCAKVNSKPPDNYLLNG